MKNCSSMEETKFISELLWSEKVSSVSLISSHPLFSCVVSFCTLLLLYFPHLFQKIILSPVLILTAILLFIILRLGSIQRSQTEEKETRNFGIPEQPTNRGSGKEKEKNSIQTEDTNSLDQVHQWIEPDSEINFRSNSRFEESFTEWNVKAPLEVIYEEYEGEEKEVDEETEEDPNEDVGTRFVGIPKYPSSMSRYYPESDSDSDGSSDKGDWDSPENICFKWEEEEREGLIEIELEEEGCEKKRSLEFYHFEEENLIEIDISPTRYGDFSGENKLFSGEISCSS